MFTFERVPTAELIPYQQYENPLGSWYEIKGEVLLAMSKQQVEELEAKWNAVERWNCNAVTENSKTRAATINSFVALFKSYGWRGCRATKRSYKIVPIQQTSLFSELMLQVMPKTSFTPSRPSFSTVLWADGTKEHLNGRTLSQMWEAGHAREKQRIAQEAKRDELLVASVKWADTHNISIVGKSLKQIIEEVQEAASEEYLKSQHGKKVGSAGCDECSTYTIGDHRCSCGNRRQNAMVQGNVVEGFYLEIEAY